MTTDIGLFTILWSTLDNFKRIQSCNASPPSSNFWGSPVSLWSLDNLAVYR